MTERKRKKWMAAEKLRVVLTSMRQGVRIGSFSVGIGASDICPRSLAARITERSAWLVMANSSLVASEST
jgi:hypothetical protein